MNTRSVKSAVIPAFLAGVISSGNLQADFTTRAPALNYDNRAYVHAIHAEPNPVGDMTVESAKIAYADKAYGQAIYSYPSNVVFQETEFNMEYVDTANGQAIYSYSNTNPVRHHLQLSAETEQPSDNFIAPVVLTETSKPSAPVNPF
jgi:hypothetical protein